MAPRTPEPELPEEGSFADRSDIGLADVIPLDDDEYVDVPGGGPEALVDTDQEI